MIRCFNIANGIDHHVFPVREEQIDWRLHRSGISSPCAGNAFRIVLHREKMTFLDLPLDGLLGRTDFQRTRDMEELTEEAFLFSLSLHRKNIRGNQIVAIATNSPVWA